METGAAGSMGLRPLVDSSPLQGSRVIHPRSCDCHQEKRPWMVQWQRRG